MKLEKLNLNQLADAELNEREMCHILGGGTPGNCQCGCHFVTSGGSSTSSNDSANDAGGLVSDLTPTPTPKPGGETNNIICITHPTMPQDKLCGHNSDPMC